MGSSPSHFNRSTTDTQVLNGNNLKGKHLFVTGGTSGIGFQLAKTAFNHGCKVTLASRSEDRLKEARDKITHSKEESVHPGGELRVIRLDLSDLDTFDQMLDEYEAGNSFGPIDVLTLNAGLYKSEKNATKQGFEMAFGVNHLGHFALCMKMLKRRLLHQNKAARIVVVSSRMHHAVKEIDFNDPFFEQKSYSGVKSYAQSKLANILFCRKLDELLKKSSIWNKVHVYSLHPGWIQTNFDRDITGFFQVVQKLGRPFQKSIPAGAATSMYCSFHEGAAEESGLYYSDCQATKPSKAAQSDSLAQKLWTFSVEKTGEDFPQQQEETQSEANKENASE